MLILTAQDIKQAVPMRAAIDSQKQAYMAVANKTANLPLRTPVSVPEQNAVSLFMPARVGGNLGAKIVSVFPNNAMTGKPIVQGVVVMVNADTGEPAALLDATYLTALRTAAGAGAATEALAVDSAPIAALIGSGTLARTHLLAMATARLLTEARIYSRDPHHIEAFIAEMQPQISAKLVASKSANDAVDGADLVCCITTSTTPVIDGRALKAGAHVNGVGAYTLQMQEVDSETVKRAGQVFVDSRESILAEAGDVVTPIQQGLITENDLVEIGTVLAGQHPGRASAQAITFFKSCGLAAQDVVIAGEAIRLAQSLNLGQNIDL